MTTGDTSGVLIDLVRQGSGSVEQGVIAGGFTYAGTVSEGETKHRATVTVDGTLDVKVALSPPNGELAARVRLIVRTAVKHASAQNIAPPRKIHRWRGGPDSR